MTLAESLIDLVTNGRHPGCVLNEAIIGVPFEQGMSVRSFFDGYGNLRFCTSEDILILIEPLSFLLTRNRLKLPKQLKNPYM